MALHCVLINYYDDAMGTNDCLQCRSSSIMKGAPQQQEDDSIGAADDDQRRHPPPALSRSRSKRQRRPLSSVIASIVLGCVAIVSNVAGAEAAGVVVECRCEYPDEDYYSFFDWRRRDLMTASVQLKDDNDFLVVDGETVLPKSHPACQNVLFVCPGDPFDGPLWDRVCVGQHDGQSSKGKGGPQKASKKSGKAGKGNKGHAPSKVIFGRGKSKGKASKKGSKASKKGKGKEKRESKSKSANQKHGKGHKRREHGKGKGSQIVKTADQMPNIFKRVKSRRQTRHDKRGLRSKGRKHVIARNEYVVLPSDNPLCSDFETFEPTIELPNAPTSTPSSSTSPTSSTQPSVALTTESPSGSGSDTPTVAMTVEPTDMRQTVVVVAETNDVETFAPSPAVTFAPIVEWTAPPSPSPVPPFGGEPTALEDLGTSVEQNNVVFVGRRPTKLTLLRDGVDMSAQPVAAPSATPSKAPSARPSMNTEPSGAPTNVPTETTSSTPSVDSPPSASPTSVPRNIRTVTPTVTSAPSAAPTILTTDYPSTSSSDAPSAWFTRSKNPTATPTVEDTTASASPSTATENRRNSITRRGLRATR